jgi:hypothetical protein
MAPVMSSGRWPALVADIGGTNARFAIVESPGAAPDRIEILSAADYRTLGQAIAAFLDMTGIRPPTACLAVAGPVVDGHVRFSNRGWSLSAVETADRFDLDRVLLVNDHAARSKRTRLAPPSARHLLCASRRGSGQSGADIGSTRRRVPGWRHSATHSRSPDEQRLPAPVRGQGPDDGPYAPDPDPSDHGIETRNK